MRMRLKNKNIKLNSKKLFNNAKFNSKNLFIFLISLSIIAILVGIFSFLILNSSDKEGVINSINTNFNIPSNYDYIHIIKNELLKNSFNIFLIWILGLSVVGILINILIYFLHLFSIGFTSAAIINKYGIKGIVGILCYLFPSKLIYIIILFLITFFAIKISYKLVKLCFFKEEINIRNEMNKYFKILLFSFIIILFLTLTTAFIDPFFIKLFTNIK